MLGPDTHSGRSRPRRLSLDKRIEQPGGLGAKRQCELCEAEANAGVKYGMAVCRSCDEELLP